MPLKDAVPVIDDRKYGDILEELRARVPRYTPEWTPVWTDLNDNDPGLTLAQLFAWLTEMLIFRLARVPELNYIKFLELLGVELRARQPARAEITFPVKPTHPRTHEIVRLRTQVSGEGESGPPVVFETERALIALTARLDGVQAFDGYAYRDVTGENDSAARAFEPFGPIPDTGAALLLGFRYPTAYTGAQELPSVELNLAVWVATEGSGRNGVTCGLPEARAYPSATLRWEGWNGASWQRVDLIRDDTRALTRTGHVSLKLPAAGVVKAEAIGQVTAPMFWLRARIERSGYERPPLLLAVRTNTVTAVQAETLRDEVLGGSNGRRDQVFKLANMPVLSDSLTVEVDEGDKYRPWKRVDDFFESRPTDLHYVLNPNTGEVRFGDGENGRIPVANVNNRANIVAREYRFGGGKRGNLPGRALKTLVTSVEGIDASGVGNLFPAFGGQEEETLDQARKRAPRALRSRCRAVSVEDYELLALQAGVRRAKALPLFHPSFPGVKVPGVVTVIVVPDSDAPAPTPSDGLLRTVCAYLDQRRLLTAELYVTRPSYQRVEVQGDVQVEDDADLGEVKKGIEDGLATYFHPLWGGEDGEGWPFGGAILYSRVYQRVFSVPGVRSIERLVIVLDGEPAEECRDVPIAENALLYSTDHHVDVRYAFTEEETA